MAASSPSALIHPSRVMNRWVQLVAGIIAMMAIHTQKKVVDCLFYLHPLKLNLLRQARERILNAGLGEQQICIRVASNLKNDRKCELPIARGLAADVLHPFHAVDCLF